DFNGGIENAYWTLTDRMGSVRDVTDNTGVVKDHIAWDGWGNITSESASAFRGRYGWTGRELDVETGLQYNRARYYDPASGRWISEDPLGFDAGDSNLYRYVSNAPPTLTDPSGFVEQVQVQPKAIGGGQINVPQGPKGQLIVTEKVAVTVLKQGIPWQLTDA